jgi:uncharacterized protein YkwD
MNRPRVAAIILSVLVLGGLTALAAIPPPEETPVAAITSSPTTTEAPDFAVLVESGAVTAIPPEEQQLTEEALARSTTTTTTTVPDSTTTSIQDTSTTTAVGPTTTAAKRSETTSPSSPATTTPPTTTPTTTPPTTSPPTTAPSGGEYVASAEKEFASRINSYRGSKGARSLSRNGSLDSYARAWAKKMASNGGLSHSNIGSLLDPWVSVGENIAVGGAVGGIFDALVASNGHRDNMLGDFTHVGIGVWRDAQGALWTCHVFAR